MKDKTSFFIKGFTETAFFTFVSRISGFIRDIFIAAFLGAGIFSDIFIIAFKLPNLFRRITAEGALTSAFLPIYSKLKEHKGDVFALVYFKNILYQVSISLFVLMTILQIIMPFLIYFLAPGFADNKEVTSQIITLTRITIIFMPLISVASLLGVATNVSGRFWILAFTPIILNTFIIISCFLINDYWIIKSLPLAIATVLAGFTQVVFIAIMIIKYDIFKYQDFFKNAHQKKNNNYIKVKIIETWRKFIPAAFGGGILQINLLVDTILASLIGFGSISYLYFADRITQLPVGLIGIALGTTLLVSLSKSNANRDTNQFSKELIISLRIGLFFSIPSALVFINFSDLLIKVLFERGEFSFQETIQTSYALLAYALGVPAFIMLKSCQPAFLAEGNTKIPMYIGFVLLILNIILSFSLMIFLKHAGIALATSLVSWIGTLIYITLLVKTGKITRPKFSFEKNNTNLFSVIFYGLKITSISCLMILSMKLLQYILEINNLNKTSILIILCIFGFFMYILTSKLFKFIPQELNYLLFLKSKKVK